MLAGNSKNAEEMRLTTVEYNKMSITVFITGISPPGRRLSVPAPRAR